MPEGASWLNSWNSFFFSKIIRTWRQQIVVPLPHLSAILINFINDKASVHVFEINVILILIRYGTCYKLKHVLWTDRK
jgi:hypothetical protein